MADNNIDRDETAIEEKEKKREDLVPESLLLENDQEVLGFQMADAATYVGMTRGGLDLILKRLRKEGRPIQVYTKAYGGISRYLLKKDLDELRRVKPVE